MGLSQTCGKRQGWEVHPGEIRHKNQASESSDVFSDHSCSFDLKLETVDTIAQDFGRMGTARSCPKIGLNGGSKLVTSSCPKMDLAEHDTC